MIFPHFLRGFYFIHRSKTLSRKCDIFRIISLSKDLIIFALAKIGFLRSGRSMKKNKLSAKVCVCLRLNIFFNLSVDVCARLWLKMNEPYSVLSISSPAYLKFLAWKMQIFSYLKYHINRVFDVTVWLKRENSIGFKLMLSVFVIGAIKKVNIMTFFLIIEAIRK